MHTTLYLLELKLGVRAVTTVLISELISQRAGFRCVVAYGYHSIGNHG